MKLVKEVKVQFANLRCIDTIKISDAKAWLIELKDNGLAYGTVIGFKRALKPRVAASSLHFLRTAFLTFTTNHLIEVISGK
jgi:hypothetical protein